MNTVTRFAPSPTGYLHIGSARTALFNFLYAKHTNGKFLIRVEDTDKKRSTSHATNAILSGLKWLGLDHDDSITYQTNNIDEHVKTANDLISKGHAYYCLEPLEKITKKREEYKLNGKVYQFQSEWRDKDISLKDIPEGASFVIRLKMPKENSTTIEDMVQGTVSVENSHLDDLVILRSDGTPTYMLAVVVDDHNSGVTHIIRGDDHLNNAFKQVQIYKAMGWKLPKYAHIPLIHGEDGTKLSKRHGAIGVEAYKEMGYLPDALNNYLMRLGWSHGDDEIICMKDAIQWFDACDINKAAARIDFSKMQYINAHYIANTSNEDLVRLITPFVNQNLLTKNNIEILQKGMNGLKTRAKTIKELACNAMFYLESDPITINSDANEIIKSADIELITKTYFTLEKLANWSEDDIKLTLKAFVKEQGVKLGQVAQVFRSMLTGSTTSPSVFEIMSTLGKNKSLRRINRFLVKN